MRSPRCSWIVEPANTWSNLFYVIAALILWRWSHERQVHSLIRGFAPSALVVGLFSFIYHASNTFFFQVFDFVGMFVFLGLPLALNLKRLRATSVGLTWATVIASGTGLVFLLRSQELAIQPLVAALILGIVVTEAACRYRRADSPSYGPFWLALALLAGAGAFSFLDLTRTWCNPDNHVIQGHALWHMLAAASMLPLYRFYESIFD